MAINEVQLIIKSCKDCPRFRQKRVTHWLANPNDKLYRYWCDEAGRDLIPQEGIEPPPKWCPKRDAEHRLELTRGSEINTAKEDCADDKN